MNKSKIPDEDYNKNWQALLAEFKSIDHTKANANEKYLALKEKVNSVEPLTPAQSAGIKERCNNAINGTYNLGDMGYKQNNYDKNRSENKK